MSELSRLRDEHEKLDGMFHRLGDIIERESPPPQIELFELRRELTSALLAHLKLEDWALYPRLIASGDPEVATAGRVFREEMGGLAPAFLDYSDRWNAATIEADWDGYRNHTRAILDALFDRLSREDRGLLPLLERLDTAA